MLPHKHLYVLHAGISLHHLALSLCLDFSPTFFHSCPFFTKPSAFQKEKQFAVFESTLKCPLPPPSCSILFWLCFRDVLKELEDRTLQELQASKLCAEKPFSTEVEKSSFPTWRWEETNPNFQQGPKRIPKKLPSSQ